VTPSHADQTPNGHPSDGILLAMHDGERGVELDVYRRHVEECLDCRTRLAAIAGHANTVRQALSEIPVPAMNSEAWRERAAAARTSRASRTPRTPRTPRSWRRQAGLAAAAVIVVSVVAAASPIRRWVKTHVMRSSTPARSAPSTPSAERAGSIPDRSGSTLSFVTSGPEFTMRLDSLPAAGMLVIGRATGGSFSIQVAAGAGTGGDVMVVLPNELEVRNTSASRASYTVSVPRTVARFRVVVAGRAVFDGSPPAQVPLGR
jgi:hypothetical protein